MLIICHSSMKIFDQSHSSIFLNLPMDDEFLSMFPPFYLYKKRKQNKAPKSAIKKTFKISSIYGNFAQTFQNTHKIVRRRKIYTPWEVFYKKKTHVCSRGRYEWQCSVFEDKLRPFVCSCSSIACTVEKSTFVQLSFDGNGLFHLTYYDSSNTNLAQMSSVHVKHTL